MRHSCADEGSAAAAGRAAAITLIRMGRAANYRAERLLPDASPIPIYCWDIAAAHARQMRCAALCKSMRVCATAASPLVQHGGIGVLWVQ